MKKQVFRNRSPISIRFLSPDPSMQLADSSWHDGKQGVVELVFSGQDLIFHRLQPVFSKIPDNVPILLIVRRHL